MRGLYRANQTTFSDRLHTGRALWFLFSAVSASLITPVAWASGNERIDVKAVRSTEVTDRLAHEPTFFEGGAKAGLSALKELLFDEMALFTIASAMVLLVALIGAAVIISKRSS